MSADDLMTRLLLGVIVLAVLGWLAWHALGEILFSRELRRPAREPRAGWETCLLRVDPTTGAPWREPVADNEAQVEPVGGA